MQIIETGQENAEELMTKDRVLFESLSSMPLLHMYQFAPKSATYGYFVNPSDFFLMENVEQEKMKLARRPTGGGVIFHMWDLAFSVLIPASSPLFSHDTMKNYATINRQVLRAVQRFLGTKHGELASQDGNILGSGCAHFCMAKPTRYDVLLEGKKIAGAAQRKTKHGFLHQGSISLLMPEQAFIASLLKPDLHIIEGMNAYTFPLLGKDASLKDLNRGRQEMSQLLIEELQRLGESDGTTCYQSN